jgi:hypothetical protein
MENKINFLDVTIIRWDHHRVTDIYRSPTTINMTKHYTSNHPMEQKVAAYTYLLDRKRKLLLIPQQLKMNTILHTAKANGFPSKVIT